MELLTHWAAVWGIQPPVLGLLLQVLSTACLAVMSLVAKLGGKLGLPVFELVLARSLVLLAMSTAMLARRGAAAEWPWRSNRRLLFVLRGSLGFCAISCLYWAVQYLPLGDTAVLTFLAPIFVAAAAPRALGERGARGLAPAMALCCTGMVLVVQPEFLFGGGAAALSAVGVAIGVGQAFFSAAAKLCIRSLNSSEPVASIIFAMAGVSSLGSAAACALLPHHFVLPRSAAMWGVLGAAGVLGCAVQLLVTTALKLAKAAPVLAMSYFMVVWSMLLDTALGDRPGLLSLLGAALVCASSFIVILAQRRESDSSSEGSRPTAALKAKDSRRTFGAAAGAPWQAAGSEDEGRSGGSGGSDGSQLELAEGGRLHGGTRVHAVQWGSAAAAAAEPGEDERTPLISGKAPASGT